MAIRRCRASNCGRPYQVNEFRSSSLLNAYRGRITCPHCGTLELASGESIYLTHALSKEEECKYEIQNFPEVRKQA
jgi:hypothetical protein